MITLIPNINNIRRVDTLFFPPDPLPAQLAHDKGMRYEFQL